MGIYHITSLSTIQRYCSNNGTRTNISSSRVIIDLKRNTLLSSQQGTPTEFFFQKSHEFQSLQVKDESAYTTPRLKITDLDVLSP